MTSMETPPFDSDTLVVNAHYFIPVELEETNIRQIQNTLSEHMMYEGYSRVQRDSFPFRRTDRRVSYIANIDTELPLRYRVLSKIVGDESDYKKEVIFEQIEERRPDVPFEFDIQFSSVERGEQEGYDVYVRGEPTLLRQYQINILDRDNEYDTKLPVDTTKRRIRDFMASIEAIPIVEPHTKSKAIDERLSDPLREILKDTEYGPTVLRYLDEGNEAMSNNLTHAALSCYIQAIEWTVITFYFEHMDRDLIQEGQDRDSPPYFFNELVELLDETPATKKTTSRLSSMNQAERRWIAHYKTGIESENEVIAVQERLLILIRELFFEQGTV